MHRLPAALIALLLACAASSAPAASGGSGIAWACHFEGTYCGMSEQSKAEPGRRSAFTFNARDGNLALELTTMSGDDQVHGSGDWERDDLALAPSPDYCNEGQEEWWAVSILFPDAYATSDLGEVMDFHHHADGGQANMNLVAEPWGLRLHGFYGDVKHPDEYKAELGRIRRNAWYDFVYHVKWSSTRGGFFVAWLNGRKVLTHRGPTLYPGISCYLKLANYHAPAHGTSSIVFDRVIRGASESDVALQPLEH